eukprot:GHUV01035790.1.p1 GENE.GHUV01035790.1~~GHUV01035790.1.p1  ORF type:complete len:343 (+),score=85.48 GHUV01035790.1:708-1736(+)
MSHLKALSLAAINGQQQVVPDLRQLCPLLYQQLHTFSGAQQQLQGAYQPNKIADQQQCLLHASAAASNGVAARSVFSLQPCTAAQHSVLLAKSSCSGLRHVWQHAGGTVARDQQCIGFDRRASSRHRCFTHSSVCSINEAECSNGLPSGTNSTPHTSHLVDVEDTLKLAALIRRFRDRGHLIAQLDPLKRTAGGPWLGPIGDEYTRSDHTLMRLMTGYPAAAPAAQRCAYVAGQLGLAGHADPGRLFAVGQLMPGLPDGSPAKPLWALHEAVEVMASTYCGTLAIEYKHLQQQDEMAWMEQRFESRQPLTPSQRKKVATYRTAFGSRRCQFQVLSSLLGYLV